LRVNLERRSILTLKPKPYGKAPRTCSSLGRSYEQGPKRLRRTVQSVCSDLYQGFIGAAKAVFGKRVHICADRFHVAKLYRNGLENLRKSEWKRLCHILSEEERKSFKNVHWLLRQRRADLNADERRMLNRLFRYSPKLQEAYEACESLTAIYESRLSKGQGKRKLRGWMEGLVHKLGQGLGLASNAPVF
jgi:transposase